MYYKRRVQLDSIGVSVDELSKLSSGKLSSKGTKETVEEQLTNKTYVNYKILLLKIVIRWDY